MRIGLIGQLNGVGADAPTWETLVRRASTAEQTGFDCIVFEDALMYRGEAGTSGVWESTAVIAGLAAVTSSIEIGHSVVNSPYRSPALLASLVTTLDEISGGRYLFAIGAGNTPESDYEGFGFPSDRRFSRFAEAIELLHTLLKTGKVDYQGQFHSAQNAELVLRGPRKDGPPITIAGAGPRMLGLVARFGDGWNWWAYDESIDEVAERFGPILETLDKALNEEGREPESLERSIDLYTVVAPGFDPPQDRPGIVAGEPGQILEYLAGLAELGFGEVHCDVWPSTDEAVAAMAPVVEGAGAL